MKKSIIKKPIKKKKSVIKEWLKAVLVAVIFIIIIKLFVFQSFVINDSKMESSLFPGDFIVINKLDYGARFPITL